MSDKRFGKFGMLELPLGVQSVIDHPVQAYVKNPLGLRGGLNMACFNFTGSNYASIAALSTNLIGGGGSFTVSALILGTNYGLEGKNPFCLYGDSDNYASVMYPKNAAQAIRRDFRVSGVSSGIDSIDAPTVWATLNMVWVSATKRFSLYLNGVQITNASPTASPYYATASTVFNMGSFSETTKIFTGKLADIRIYSAVVTPNHSIPATSESDVVAWYPYPNTAGNARDASGNGNHMTTTGGTLYSATGGPGLPWVTLP